MCPISAPRPASPGRSGRPAAARCRCPVPSATSTASETPRAAPKRASAAAPRWRRCRRPRAARALAHHVAERTSGERQVGRPAQAAVCHLRPGRDPKPTASHVGSGRPQPSSTTPRRCRASPRAPLRATVRCTLWWTTRPSSTTPPRSFVPLRRYRSRRGGMAGRYTEVCDRPDLPGASGVQGLPRPQAPLAARRRSRRLRRKLSRVTGPRARPGRRAQADHPRARAQVGGAGDRGLAAALARPVPGQRPAPGRRLRRRRARPLRRRQPARRAATSSCSAPTRAPATRSTKRSRAVARGHDHGRARRARRGAQAVDPPRHRGRDPRPRLPQDQRRLRPRRAGADDRDGRGVPRQRASRSTTWSRWTSRTSPAFIDALGGITVDNKTRICSPPFDNFWKGLHSQGGDRPGRRGGRSVTPGVRKNPCAPAEDDRARAAATGGAAGDRRAGQVAEHVLPAPVGELAGAQGAEGPT